MRPGEAARHAAVAPRRQRPADARRSGCGAGPRTRWSARGLYEVVGWSFAAPDLADRLRLAADDRARASCGCATR